MMNQKTAESLQRWAEIKGYNEGLNDGWADAIDEAIETVQEAQKQGRDPLEALLDLRRLAVQSKEMEVLR